MRAFSEGIRQPAIAASRGVILVCLTYIWLRPVSANLVLVPVLFAFGASSVVAAWLGEGRIAQGFRPTLVVQLLLAVLGITVGALNHTPGIWYGVLVYLAAPILYWWFVAALDFDTIRRAMLVLAISTAALSTVIVLYVAGERHIIPQLVPGALLIASGAGFGSSIDISSQVRFYGLSTLAASGPIWCASLFMPRDRFLPSMPVRAYAAGASILAALVGGRRAIVVVTVLAPLIAYICSRVIEWQRAAGPNVDRTGASRFAYRWRAAFPVALIVLVVGIAYVVLPSVVSVSAITRSFASVQDIILGGGATADVRVAEARALIDGWLRSPIVGNGFGAVLPSYVRDPNRPWNFELQYHLLLFQTGLVGVALVLSALLVTTRQLRKAGRSSPLDAGTLVATTVGAVALLMANAVDPYLQAPGHMWALYLPIAVANVILLSEARGATTTPNL